MRFNLIAAAALAAVASCPLAAQEAAQSAFSNLSEENRVEVQAVLKAAGHYTAAVDGRWGPSTQAAVEAAADQLSALGLQYNLGLEEGAADIMAFIASEAGQGVLAPDEGPCPGCEYIDGYYERQAASEAQDEFVPGFPEWIQGKKLPWGATLEQWLAAGPDVKLRTAAQYQANVIKSDRRLSQLIANGTMLTWSHNMIECIEQLADFGLSTGQKSMASPVNELVGGCAIILGQA